MSEKRLVSDALGRERAIQMIRAILDDYAKRSDPLASSDGCALKILLALDHAQHREEGER